MCIYNQFDLFPNEKNIYIKIMLFLICYLIIFSISIIKGIGIPYFIADIVFFTNLRFVATLHCQMMVSIF